MNIYRLSGQYLGFVVQENIFRWDGYFLGWLDTQNFIWDKNGVFRGRLVEQNGNLYALRSNFLVLPVARSPRTTPPTPSPLPTPTGPVQAYQATIGVEDAF